MTRIEEIEQAVAALPDDDYRVFRQWFLNRDWEKWDLQIEDDVKEGRLALLLDEANQAKQNGALREF